MNWLKKIILWFLEWLLGDAIQPLIGEVIVRKQVQLAEEDRIRQTKRKKYHRVFTYEDGVEKEIQGSADEICLWPDEKAQTLHPESKLVHVKEKSWTE